MDQTAPIHARIDPEGRMISADEPLAGLQLRAGGFVPGTIAIPSLLALVRKARRQQLRLARTISAHDEGRIVSAWAEVEPDDEGASLVLSRWRSEAAPEATLLSNPRHELELVRHVAEAQFQLDEAQHVRFASVQAPDLAALARKVRDNPGHRWTEFVRFEALDGRGDALHWRLLDGAVLTIEGSDRRWTARLSPHAAGGFELFLLPAAIDALPQDLAPRPAADNLSGSDAAYATLLGRELGPALRQPIDRIIANAETIRTRLLGPLADEYAAYAGDIADAARHLLELVKDLADLDAVEAPDFAPAADAIDLADCAIRAGGLLSVRASRSRITLTLPPREPEVPATGEFRRVLQVLINLVGNAINYSPEGSRISLECGTDGTRAWVAVADEGPGVTEDQARRMFEKFERLGRANDGGSGLGLYIARRLARAMKGDLTVAATPGHGARFVLTLPARAV